MQCIMFSLGKFLLKLEMHVSKMLKWGMCGNSTLPGPTIGCLNPNILINCDFVAHDIESLSSRGIQSMMVDVEDKLSSKPSLDIRNLASSVLFFGLKCFR